MLNSEATISSYALSLIGLRAIKSTDEDNTRSRLCENVLPISIEVVLARLDWPFARHSMRLSSDPTVDTEEGTLAYALPADCVTPNDVAPFGSGVDWEVMGEFILAAEAEYLLLKYTRRIPDPTKFSAGFKSCVARHMAAQMAGPLTKASVKDISTLIEYFELELSNATLVDANVGGGGRDTSTDPSLDSFNS